VGDTDVDAEGKRRGKRAKTKSGLASLAAPAIWKSLTVLTLLAMALASRGPTTPAPIIEP